ncbi:MAG: hypothetical protein ACTHJ5_00815 [Ilyomonas sp.]
MNIKLIILFVLLAIVSSCTSTRITSSWKATDTTNVKYNHVLVLALSQPDNSLKEKMEQHLVDDLRSHGINAVSAYKQYGPKAFERLDENTAIDKIQSSGTDAILTIVLLDKSKERNYVPGHVVFTPYAVYYRRFWGYYTTLYSRVYTPGYYVTNTDYFWESNLYDASTRQLVYSVQTKSFNPNNAELLAHEYGQIIVNNMIERGVIGK